MDGGNAGNAGAITGQAAEGPLILFPPVLLAIAKIIFKVEYTCY